MAARSDGNIEVPPPTDAFRRACAEASIEFEPGDLERLHHFLQLLYETNARFNLTAIRDPQGAWMGHVFDSLTLVPCIVSADAKTVADVGSGGGAPGLPLAIVLPNVQFTLIESTGKKARFLEKVCDELDLNNCVVVTDRAETLGRDRAHHRDQYDVVTARAVGPLWTLIELTAPLAKPHGHVLAIKGEKAQQEVEEAKQALHLLHCTVVDTQRTATGTIIIIEKLRKCPKPYPRRPGEPKRSPLGAK